MIGWLPYAMVFLGSALMVYNIYCFVRFAQFIKARDVGSQSNAILYVPIVLLVLFLAGYLAVGLLGNPDIIVGLILFGGSIFVFIMHRLIDKITQRVIESERLQAELMAAEESNLAKTRFLASISHEMRTPMNVILGLDSIALNNPDLPAETRTQLEKIGQSGRHLLDLINNILDLNSIETGELVLKAEPFSLQDMVGQVNAIAGAQCEEKGLLFETTCTPAAQGRYIGDEMLLKQVLLIILDNAVKYTDAPGTVCLSVDAAPADEGRRMLTFDISDTGVGISPEYLHKIFEVFGQEDASSTSRFGGSGLGLASAKSKMELMGGTITVKSQKNEGSTFTVSVPLEAAPEEAAPDERDGEQKALEALEGRRILVVEDLPENAEIVMDLLELEDAESEHAENGQVALDMFGQSAPYYYDAVLMDLRMPVMDGLEATRSIRALDREDAKTVPILALTANAFESDVQQSFEAGMDAHLVKPVDADEMYAALKKLIAQAQERMANTGGTS